MINGMTTRFSGLAQRIFQFGAVMGWAVNPPKNTIKQPNIPENRNKSMAMVLRKKVHFSFCRRKIRINVLTAKIKMGCIYQG